MSAAVVRLPVLQGAAGKPAAPAEHDPQPSHGRRRHPIPSRTIAVKNISRRDLDAGRLLYPPEEHADVQRPATRADCLGGQRPCPWAGCKYHLALDVSDIGSITHNFPDVDPLDMAHTCALDVADQGGATLEEVGALMNLTRERIRQVELVALRKVTQQIAVANGIELPAGERAMRTDRKE